MSAGTSMAGAGSMKWRAPAPLAILTPFQCRNHITKANNP